MTAADQPPAEWVEKAANAICKVSWSGLLSDHDNELNEARAALAAVWPLVQAMVRDAKVETLDEAITRVGQECGYGCATKMLDTLRRELQT